MRILSRTGGIASTSCHLIADEASGMAVLFDAPDHTVGPLLDEVKRAGWNLRGLWLTHGHFDHIADHAVVTERFPEARLLMHRLDEPKLQFPERQTSLFAIPLIIPPRKADDYVDDGQQLQLGGLKVEVIHTPGHSPGHVVYYFPDEKLLIGGDLIICGAVGRTDFPDCDETALWRSIRRILQLPPETRLLPGHCNSTTLGHEMKHNPYVRQAMQMKD